MICLILWIVQTKWSTILDDSVFEHFMGTNIGFCEDVVAFITAILACHRHKRNPFKVQIRIFSWLPLFDIGESAIDSAKEMIAYMLSLGVRIEPLAIFPKWVSGPFIR